MPGLNILPEKEYDRHERELVLHQALNRLEKDQRSVIVLVDLHDLDYQETAQILGIPIGTVKSRLARARLRLCQLLSPKGAVSAF
jgi:RNA polymerase sigma-70 factor (ECF subfamily)